MPELPEAETIARALDARLKAKRIAKVEVFAPALRTPLKPLLEARLKGRKFLGCRRRARYAVADLDDGRQLMFHFGMSGVVRVEDAALPRRKHEHVVITLEDGEAIKFEDPRRFGCVEVQAKGADGWPTALANLGVEPLSPRFTGAYLYQAASRSRKPVKELLMDNLVVTGIGNIYAAETLFAAGVSPLRHANRLTPAECTRLVREAKRILRLAIRWGGTTVSDFRHVDGTEGKFVQKLRIYGKRVCPKCGGTTATARLGGRTSWYCPHCQG